MVDSYFRESRNVELSTIYYLRNIVAANWTDIPVILGFPSDDAKEIPVICVRLLSDNPIEKEIGSTEVLGRYNIVIDIFAKNDGQRLDLADFIKDSVKAGWTYYLHSQASGSPKTLNRTANGNVKRVAFLDNSRVSFGDDVDTVDKYRHIISLTVKVN